MPLKGSIVIASHKLVAFWSNLSLSYWAIILYVLVFSSDSIEKIPSIETWSTFKSEKFMRPELNCELLKSSKPCISIWPSVLESYNHSNVSSQVIMRFKKSTPSTDTLVTWRNWSKTRRYLSVSLNNCVTKVAFFFSIFFHCFDAQSSFFSVTSSQ